MKGQAVNVSDGGGLQVPCPLKFESCADAVMGFSKTTGFIDEMLIKIADR